MHRPLARAHLPLLAGLALLAGCPADDGGSSLALCGPEAEKRAIVDLVRDWYLYPETLPPAVDVSHFATAAEVLEYMTSTWSATGSAVALGLDRHGWSYTTTLTAARATYEEGTSVGFGVGLLWRGARLYVSQVYPGPAAEAGFARGDEILRVGESEATLAAVAPETVGAALGPAEPGVTRAIEVLTQAGETVVRTVTKGAFSLDPVPLVDGAERWRIYDRSEQALPPAGYLALRTFIGPADARLEEAFAAFRAAGVADVVVDLRYNGGGLISTAEHLANLLGGGLAGSPMVKLTNNPARNADQGTPTTAFAGLANTIAPARIAFVTTGSSASASELVPNVLEPYNEDAIAFVGKATYGKPVGQRGFRLGGCDAAAYLISFRLENAQGDAGYFQGLPNETFSGPLCDAEDDLARPLGDPEEASTKAALAFLATGSCPQPVAAKPGAALRATPAPDVYPEAPRPTEAQRNVRGLF